MKKRLMLGSIAGLALSAVTGLVQAQAQDNTFKIGLVLPMSGPFASTGKQM